ncbi:hypothetical protein PIB30_041827 [Stylosanthes scabra]|uniref:Reverse transcriptase zinc-binding domain-containing protein n=1 Tax=Stylosanthes scabra TaxID=79078 RepID=A0ABU6QFL7_9FABA|nr:hypothetical protein [Stylosanthes scabra]
MKNFIWKVLHEGLPVNQRLHSRIPTMSPTCPRCNSPEEIVTHLLWTCPDSLKAWRLVALLVPSCGSETWRWWSNLQSKLQRRRDVVEAPGVTQNRRVPQAELEGLKHFFGSCAVCSRDWRMEEVSHTLAAGMSLFIVPQSVAAGMGNLKVPQAVVAKMGHFRITPNTKRKEKYIATNTKPILSFFHYYLMPTLGNI